MIGSVIVYIMTSTLMAPHSTRLLGYTTHTDDKPVRHKAVHTGYIRLL